MEGHDCGCGAAGAIDIRTVCGVITFVWMPYRMAPLIDMGKHEHNDLRRNAIQWLNIYERCG
jgi:hypothetical protein